MKLLRVLSRLISYPVAETQAAVPEMRRIVAAEGDALPRSVHDRLNGFLTEIETTPLLELQENYVALFDRGRALSLHLFEHVHGESRDRGQAMVDLMNHYQAQGYMLDSYELPDYLPLFLEYLSTQDRQEVDDLLADAMGVIVLLGARLKEKGASHHIVFEALEAFVGSPEDAGDMRRIAASEGPDETIEKMDEFWAEEQVSFLANNDPSVGGCSATRQNQPAVTPVQWVDNPRNSSAAAPDSRD